LGFKTILNEGFNMDHHYKKLTAIRRKVGNNLAAMPFRYYRGPEYKPNSRGPKIMYIGKATYGWSGTPNRFIENDLQKGRYPWGQFWPFIIDLVPQIYGSWDRKFEENSRKWSLDRTVWSNLMKLGAADGNPRGQLYKLQQNTSQNILREELRLLKPNCVILVSGGDYSSDAEAVFGESHLWKQKIINDDNLWIKNLPSEYGNGRVYWTRHPQGWKSEYKSAAISKIVKDFKAHKK
jgi:hypothetical protein